MRREFSAKVKSAARERCKDHCEGCGLPLCPGQYDYDHDLPNELGGEPTLENCKVLCKGCHRAKTGKKDIPAIAKSNRIRAKHLGIKKSKWPKRGWR